MFEGREHRQLMTNLHRARGVSRREQVFDRADRAHPSPRHRPLDQANLRGDRSGLKDRLGTGPRSNRLVRRGYGANQ